MSSISKKSERQTFALLVGLDRQKERLLRTLDAPDALFLLLTGPTGSGRHLTARLYARALLCQEPQSDGACGACASCNLFDRDQHLDYITLRPSDKKIIPTQAVRDMLADLHLLPRLGRRKVIEIEGDALNEQGQNALLKSLETPPDFVTFVMLATNERSLLPTIRSRAVQLPLTRRSDRDLQEILVRHGVTGEEALAHAVRYGEGLPGRALAVAGDLKTAERVRDMANLLFRLPGRRYADLLTEDLSLLLGLRGKDRQSDELEPALTALAVLLRDQMAVVLDGGSLRHVEYETGFRTLAQELQSREDGGRAALAAATDAVFATRKALLAYGSAETVLAEMLLRIRKELTPA